MYCGQYFFSPSLGFKCSQKALKSLYVFPPCAMPKALKGYKDDESRKDSGLCSSNKNARVTQRRSSEHTLTPGLQRREGDPQGEPASPPAGKGRLSGLVGRRGGKSSAAPEEYPRDSREASELGHVPIKVTRYKAQGLQETLQPRMLFSLAQTVPGTITEPLLQETPS